MFMSDCPPPPRVAMSQHCEELGKKIADWLLRGLIQCANIQVLIALSITASVHKFGGCGYGDAVTTDFDIGLSYRRHRHSVWTQDLPVAVLYMCNVRLKTRAQPL